jgi:hypothetical protein
MVCYSSSHNGCIIVYFTKVGGVQNLFKQSYRQMRVLYLLEYASERQKEDSGSITASRATILS